MRIRKICYGLFLLLLNPPVQAQNRDLPAVKYISAEGVYVNVGKIHGLNVGDSLVVGRGKRAIALLRITHASSQSAACKILVQKGEIRIGDRVFYRGGRRRTARKSRQAAIRKSTSRKKSTRTRGKRRKRRRKKNRHMNEINGYLALQNYVQFDFLNSRRTTLQPSVDTRFKVRNLAGSGIAFRLRHRSRMYYRSATSSAEIPRTEWAHRLYEFGFVLERDTAPVQFGLGRVISPYIRGIGTIDGGHVAVRASEHILLGMALGAEPEVYDTNLELDRRKVGFFVTYEDASTQKRFLSTTLAISGSYKNHTVRREFLYWQTQFSLRNLISIYQSLELDINRGWRKLRNLQELSFTNFYLTGNVFMGRWAQLNFSFDARRNIPTYEMVQTADSLFDLRMHRGLSGGLTLYLPLNMMLRGNVSLRLRDNHQRDNLFASVFYNIRHFPFRGHFLSARLAYIRIPFTRAYRPVLTYRFPFKRRYIINLSAGGYLYRNQNFNSATYFGEINTYFTFARRYFASASLRQYFDGGLSSMQLYGEMGINF